MPPIDSILAASLLGLLLGVLAYTFRWADGGGSVAGGIIASWIFFFAGIPAFLVLLTFLILGSLATRVGYARKSLLGIAQENRGRRGALHAIANCGVGCMFALALFGWTGSPTWSAGFTGAFATALGDTVSSELGPVFGRTTRSPVTWKKVPPGFKGGVSLEGTLLGLIGSLVTVGVAVGIGFIPLGSGPIVAAAALMGNVGESVLGSLIPTHTNRIHHGLNLLNTFLGGAAAAMGVSL